jgi:hypothetical protein
MKTIKPSLLLFGILPISLALLTQAQAQSFLTNGLVAHYPFNGNANDASGSGNNCTVNGAHLATDRFGNPSGSYSFTAYPQSIATSGSAGFPSGTNDFSISLWLARSLILTNDAEIVLCNAVRNDLQLDFYPSTATTSVVDFWTGGSALSTSALSWVPNQWYNLQLVRSQNVVTIYRDGIIIGQYHTANAITAPPASDYLQFGLGVPPQIHQFYGQLDDIRVYNRALSTNEVQQLYEYETSSLTSGLVAYYPFNGNANDASGNGNNGTLIGTDWKFATDRFGNPQSALFLNNTSSWSPTLNGAYVSAPRSAALDFSGDFTLSVWVDLSTGVTNQQETLISNGSDGFGAVDFSISPFSGNFSRNDELSCGWGGVNGINTGVAPLRNAWFQFAVVRSGATATLFKNGTPLTNQVMTAAPVNNPMIWIGKFQPVPSGNQNTWQLLGGIDDVRIYNLALSPSEVQQLYLSEAGPQVTFVKAFTVDYSNLTIGSNYQLQASADMSAWTNFGTAFTATSIDYTNTDYRRIDNWNQLFFRLQSAP